MTLQQACEALNIPEYVNDIYKSNSRGELMHLSDYILLAQHVKNPTEFRQAFIHMVELANKTWQRPASVYQHLVDGMTQSCALLGLNLGTIIDFDAAIKQRKAEWKAFWAIKDDV